MKQNGLNKTNCKHKLNLKKIKEITKGKTRWGGGEQGLSFLQCTYSLLLIYKMTTPKNLCSLDSTSAVNLLKRSEIHICSVILNIARFYKIFHLPIIFFLYAVDELGFQLHLDKGKKNPDLSLVFLDPYLQKVLAQLFEGLRCILTRKFADSL